MIQQKGFTLVELAIVLMIIGLLIGGILKGQELIQNARITSTIRQFKNSDAATLTFLDSHGAFLGDVIMADTCGLAANATSYNGNNKTICSANVKTNF